jgi:hypothetical protein
MIGCERGLQLTLLFDEVWPLLVRNVHVRFRATMR